MLLSLLRSQFGIHLDALTEEELTELHAAIDRSKGRDETAAAIVVKRGDFLGGHDRVALGD
jgi:hypothetical protein